MKCRKNPRLGRPVCRHRPMPIEVIGGDIEENRHLGGQGIATRQLEAGYLQNGHIPVLDGYIAHSPPDIAGRDSPDTRLLKHLGCLFPPRWSSRWCRSPPIPGNPRRRIASSTSLHTGIPAPSAALTGADRGLNPGLVTTRSIPERMDVSHSPATVSSPDEASGPRASGHRSYITCSTSHARQKA